MKKKHYLYSLEAIQSLPVHEHKSTVIYSAY